MIRYNDKVAEAAEVIIIFMLLIVGLVSIIKFANNSNKYDDWINDKKFKYENWTTEQKIYYKVMKDIIKKDAPKKDKSEVDFIATMLVTSSKHIPYFSALVFSESIRPGKWVYRKGRIIRVRKPQLWHNFTIKDDGGSPSYGYVKIKYSTIKAVAKARGDKPPRSKWDVDIHDKSWQIRLFEYAGWFYDYAVKVNNGDEIDGIAAYKYGIKEYRKWKRKRHAGAYPWKYIKEAINKLVQIQDTATRYMLGNISITNHDVTK